MHVLNEGICGLSVEGNELVTVMFQGDCKKICCLCCQKTTVNRIHSVTMGKGIEQMAIDLRC